MTLSRTIGLLVSITSIYILWQVRQLLLLLFTAVVLSTALNQLVQQLQQWRLQRAWAVFLSITILLLFIYWIFWDNCATLF